MSELIEKLKLVINDDLLIRPPVTKFGIKDFNTIHYFVSNATEETKEEILEMVEDLYSRNNRSVLALYLLTLINLKFSNNYIVYAERFIAQFAQAKKNSVILHFAKEILQIRESTFALNLLANHLQGEGSQEELVEIWERLFHLDPKDYQLAIKIAKAKSKLDQPMDAVRYYKMAFYRTMDVKDEPETLFIWNNLIDLNAKDFSFFWENGRKLKSLLSKERKIGIFTKLFNIYFKSFEESIDQTLMFIKEEISEDIQNQELREMLIKLYREKYKEHSQLEELLIFSGIVKPWKNLAPQIDQFEKLIRFDINAIVHHKSFGYGVIKKIEFTNQKKLDAVTQTKLNIDFAKKKNHFMTLRIALSSLAICHSDDLQAMIQFNLDKAKSLAKENKEAFLDAVFHTFKKPVNSSEIKKLVSPRIIPLEEWTNTWKELKAIIAEDNRFEAKSKLFGLKKQGTSYKDELIDQFFSTRVLENQIKIADLFLANYGVVEEFNQFKSHFIENYKKGERPIASLIFLGHVERRYNCDLGINFSEEFKKSIQAGNLIKIFDQLKTNVLKHHFIDTLIQVEPETHAEKLNILYFSNEEESKNYILDQLHRNHELQVMSEITERVFKIAHSHPFHFTALAKHLVQHPDVKVEYDEGRLYLDLISILDVSYKDQDIPEKTSKAKKINHRAYSILFDYRGLFEYLKSENSEKTRGKIFDELNKLVFLENYLKVEIKELMTKIS